jgi:glycosyltransferase 2 family protein
MTRFRQADLRRAQAAAVLSLVAFCAAATLAAGYLGIDNVLAQVGKLEASLIGILLLLSLLNYGLRSWRWYVYQRSLGMQVPPGRTVLIYSAGFALTTTPAKIGELLRLWLLQRDSGYRYARTVPLVIGDRLSDATAVLLLCFAGIVSFTGYLWTAVSIGFGVMLITLLFLRPGLLVGFISISFRRVGRWPRLFAALRQSAKHAARLFTPGTYFAALALGLAGWLAESIAFYCLLAALGAPVTPSEAIFVFCFSMLVGGAAMLPGGLGGTEVTMLALLGLLDVGADTAVTATMLIRLTTLWFAVLIGFIALPISVHLTRGRERAHSKVQDACGTP